MRRRKLPTYELVRIELANILRRAAVLLRALAQGEGTT
jgi:hypothetical protein